MEVISPFEGLHDTFSIVPQEAEDTISDNNSNTSKLVTGLERRYLKLFLSKIIGYLLY